MGADHRARVDRPGPAGVAPYRSGRFALDGLNQYALPDDGIGAYTQDWGEVSRARAVCGY